MTQCPQVPLARIFPVVSPQLLSKLSRTSSAAAGTTGLIGTAPMAQFAAAAVFVHCIVTDAAPGLVEPPPTVLEDVRSQRLVWLGSIVTVPGQETVSTTT